MVRLVVRCVDGVLRLYPRRFRAQFRDDVLRSAEAELEEARGRGRLSLLARATREVLSAIGGVAGQHRWERRRQRDGASREEPSMVLFESISSDVTTAIRSLRSSPMFTGVAVLVLALGIGATTAIFSVVDAVALRGLPFPDDDRLVAVGQRQAGATAVNPNADPLALQSVAPQNYLDWAARQQVFESIAAFQFGPYALVEAGQVPEDVSALRVTSEFFDVLGVAPARGRAFTPDHEVDGDHRVAVLSDRLWRRRFGADPRALGRVIQLNGSPYEVIGIMPAGFEYPVGAVSPTELWTPIVFPAHHRVRDPSTSGRYLQVVARLKSGISVAQAAAHVDQIGLALQREHPVWNQDTLAAIRPLRDHIVGARARSWMLMLLGAVALVLAIACANVANLLLARASTREREVAVRATMGASRPRLIRQLMVESLVLGAIGTVAAVLLTFWVVAILRTALPPGLPRAALVAVDFRVLAACAAISVATAIAFGIVPALRLSRPDLTRVLNDAGRGASAGAGSRRIRSALIVGEIALSIVLLVGAALFVGSFRMLMKIEPGFDVENVLTASVQPNVAPGIGNSAPGGSVSITGAPPAPRQPPDLRTSYERLVEDVGAIAGVRYAAAIAGSTPLGGSRVMTTLTVPGGNGRKDTVNIHLVTPDYFRAMGMTIVAGRHLDPRDRAGAPPVIVITEAAARTYFAGDAVGQRVSLNNLERTIVGVLRDIQQASLETDPAAEVFAPLAQSPVVYAALVVKTDADPLRLLPAIKSAAMQVMPDVPLRSIRTMETVVGGRIAQRRLNMLLLGLFGLLALAISGAGVYGLMTYLVSLRTREIGVRMALGATRASVILLVGRHATILVGAGVVLGIAGAWAFSAGVESFLFRIEPTDPRAFAAAVAALAAVAVIATVVPARRAATLDPLSALRTS
jgi:putative ABC transport system permease protein